MRKNDSRNTGENFDISVDYRNQSICFLIKESVL